MRAHLLQDTALRYFLAVAHSGSLTEASQQLHVAGSALSRQIAALEAQLGAPLFERHPRGMLLTAAGEILALHARRSLLDAERALAEIAALQGRQTSQVRVATSDAFANELLPRLCVEFQRQHAGIAFEVESLPTPQVAEAVRQGSADIGLCFSRAPSRDVEVVYRQSAPVMALLPPGHALARAPALALAELAREPLALPAPDTAVRQLLDTACARQGLVLRPVLTSNHARLVLEFVARGGGLAMASEIVARHRIAMGEIVAVPLSDAGMDLRDVVVLTLAGRSLPPAVQGFLRLLEQRLKPPLSPGPAAPAAA